MQITYDKKIYKAFNQNQKKNGLVSSATTPNFQTLATHIKVCKV